MGLPGPARPQGAAGPRRPRGESSRGGLGAIGPHWAVLWLYWSVLGFTGILRAWIGPCCGFTGIYWGLTGVVRAFLGSYWAFLGKIGAFRGLSSLVRALLGEVGAFRVDRALLGLCWGRCGLTGALKRRTEALLVLPGVSGERPDSSGYFLRGPLSPFPVSPGPLGALWAALVAVGAAAAAPCFSCMEIAAPRQRGVSARPSPRVSPAVPRAPRAPPCAAPHSRDDLGLWQRCRHRRRRRPPQW